MVNCQLFDFSYFIQTFFLLCYRKCLICEYEKIDNNENFESCSALDNHIIKWHPNPDPPYIRCTFNNGKCTKHFTTKQKFYKHVKCAHPDDLHTFEGSETNRERYILLKLCILPNFFPSIYVFAFNKLSLFFSDIKEHSALVRGKFFSNERKSNEQPTSA